eukprot:GSA120T00012554001.1
MKLPRTLREYREQQTNRENLPLRDFLPPVIHKQHKWCKAHNRGRRSGQKERGARDRRAVNYLVKKYFTTPLWIHCIADEMGYDFETLMRLEQKVDQNKGILQRTERNVVGIGSGFSCSDNEFQMDRHHNRGRRNSRVANNQRSRNYSGGRSQVL